jgi:diaminopimelate decarboxylase
VRESITLPLLNKGDKLVIHYTGAYNLTQWMQFITLRPNVVMIDQDSKTHIIRESESVASVSGPEKTPDYLNTLK